MRRSVKQEILDEWTRIGLECRSSWVGFEVKIKGKWEFIPSDEVGAFSKGMEAMVELVKSWQ